MPRNWKGERFGIFEYPICCKISKKVKRTLWRKTFRKKVSKSRKIEKGDPLGFFNNHSVAKHREIEWGKHLFSEKNLGAEKKLKEGTLWDFQHPFWRWRKTAKNWRVDPLRNNKFSKKSLAVPKKNWKGGPFGLARYGMLRGKTGKSFLIQFARPNGASWCKNIL